MIHSINSVLISPRPIALSDEELQLDRYPVREAREPIPVKAFVRFYEAVIEEEDVAVAWTDRAVRVRFTTKAGATHGVWVWAGAVERR